jgi:hypothetical protein
VTLIIFDVVDVNNVISTKCYECVTIIKMCFSPLKCTVSMNCSLHFMKMKRISFTILADVVTVLFTILGK